MGRAGAAIALSMAVLFLHAGCAPSPPPSRSPRPTLTPATGLTWAKAPSVERSADLFPLSSNPTTGPAGPGTAGHPGNFPGQEIMADVVVAADGRLVAVGYGGLNGAWTAKSWTSTDGLTWSEAVVDATVGTFAVAVAVVDDDETGQQSFIAVGRRGTKAMSWFSVDGSRWLPISISVGIPTVAERATTISATASGVYVGGSAGPELGARSARIWHSSDGGLSWTDETPAASGQGTFAGAEVSAIAEADLGIVAIGRLGTGQRWTGSVSWLSFNNGGWTRIDDPQLADGLAVALAVTSDRIVAVGSDSDEREAVAWRSSDGTTWSRQPREDSRLYGGEKIRFTDVVVTPSGYVGVGNYVGLQYGQGTSWISSDGVSWERAPEQPVFGQAEPSAVVVREGGLVSVGTFGAPDNYIPTVWLSPGLP